MILSYQGCHFRPPVSSIFLGERSHLYLFARPPCAFHCFNQHLVADVLLDPIRLAPGDNEKQTCSLDRVIVYSLCLE